MMKRPSRGKQEESIEKKINHMEQEISSLQTSLGAINDKLDLVLAKHESRIPEDDKTALAKLNDEIRKSLDHSRRDDDSDNTPGSSGGGSSSLNDIQSENENIFKLLGKKFISNSLDRVLHPRKESDPELEPMHF